jgi:hypothetical protein
MTMTFRERLLEVLSFAENDAKANAATYARTQFLSISHEVFLRSVQAVITELHQYALMHKSHIEVDQVMSEAAYGWLTQAKVQVHAVDVTPMVEVVQSKNGEDFILGQHRAYIQVRLCNYLEAPKPEGP